MANNSTGLIDNNSLGVLTTLGFDILSAVLMACVWLILRKYRGDKQTVGTEVHRQTLGATNVLFQEESIVEPKTSKNLVSEESAEAKAAPQTDRVSAIFSKLFK